MDRRIEDRKMRYGDATSRNMHGKGFMRTQDSERGLVKVRYVKTEAWKIGICLMNGTKTSG